MNDLKVFIKSYWDYFLEIEEQFLETKKFVDYDKINSKTFSIEYLKLYQAVCSEIDVVGKEIACSVEPSFKIDRNTNIKKWGYIIQNKFPSLKNIHIIFNDEIEIYPFKNWEYEEFIDKKGRRGLRIVGNKQAITWWRDYNKVKHQRIGLVTNTKNFCLANQENLILAYSALYLIEIMYIDSFDCKNDIDIKPSKLFKIK